MHKDTHTHTTPVQSDLYRDLKKRENHGRVLFFCPKEAFKKVRATTSMVHIFSNGVRAEKKNAKDAKKISE